MPTHKLGMKNILVPTDFSQNSKNALKYAQVLYTAWECNFYVLHVGSVLESQEDSEHISNGDEARESSKQQLMELVDEARKQSTAQAHNFFGLHEYGFFIPTIKKYVVGHNINLIVMGTKGATGIKEKVVGSHSGDVITKVQCNTLVIPNDVSFGKPKEIAFPTDFNIFYSPQILRSMAELLELGEGSLRIMNALNEEDGLTAEQEANKEFLLDFMDASFPDRFSSHSLTNKSVKSAIQCFVESRNIDIMAMVAKNLNFIQQILFDSIVEQISFHTKIPFFVIHE